LQPVNGLGGAYNQPSLALPAASAGVHRAGAGGCESRSYSPATPIAGTVSIRVAFDYLYCRTRGVGDRFPNHVAKPTP